MHYIMGDNHHEKGLAPNTKISFSTSFTHWQIWLQVFIANSCKFEYYQDWATSNRKSLTLKFKQIRKRLQSFFSLYCGKWQFTSLQTFYLIFYFSWFSSNFTQMFWQNWQSVSSLQTLSKFSRHCHIFLNFLWWHLI